MSDWISGLLGGLGSAAAAGINYASQQSVLDWEKQAQQITWNREDNAMQRKVADLKAAGINPLLAAGGSGSPTSAPVRLEAPQVKGNPVMDAIQAASVANSMAQTKAQTELTKAQVSRVQAEKTGIELDNQLKAGTVQNKIDQSVEDLREAMSSADLRSMQAKLADFTQQAAAFDPGIARIEAARRVAEQTAGWPSLSKAVQDAVIAETAARAAKYDLEWRQKGGLPASGSVPAEVQTASSIAGDTDKGRWLLIFQQALETVGRLAGMASKVMP